MNDTDSIHESIATSFWSGLLVHSRKDGCDQVHLSPVAGKYVIRVHDQAGWRELSAEGSAEFYAALLPRLKALIGRSSDDVIPEPGARCLLRLARNNQFEVIVTTRRTESGAEEVVIALPRPQ